MGYGYLRRGDYENAYGAHEAAAEKYCGTIFGETRCQDNMARIRRKQKDPDIDVGFKRHCMDPDRSLFYCLIQSSASGDMPFNLHTSGVVDFS